MPSSHQLAAYVLASFLLIELPGPSLLFSIGRALTAGRKAALFSVVGNALGMLAAAIFVALGLGAVIAASASAFTALKYAGAVYVVYLGVQAIRHRGDARLALEKAEHEPHRSVTPRGSLQAGFIVGITNPKTIVFFAAFLPQFIDDNAPAAPQILLLGVLFAAMAMLSDGTWAYLAGHARDWFGRKPQRLDALGATGGVMMIGLGAVLAASGSDS